jgi:trehalose synthase
VARLRHALAPDDLGVLHDPQTAALARHFTTPDVKVVWRCHVGIDTPNQHSERGWAFLRPYLDNLDAYVFSCAQFAPASSHARSTFSALGPLRPMSRSCCRRRAGMS